MDWTWFAFGEETFLKRQPPHTKPQPLFNSSHSLESTFDISADDVICQEIQIQRLFSSFVSVSLNRYFSVSIDSVQIDYKMIYNYER